MAMTVMNKFVASEDAVEPLLEELAARFPERPNWAPADMEVVLVEALAVVLDQLADMQDRVQAEAFLETAHHNASVSYDGFFYHVDTLVVTVKSLVEN